MKNEREVRLAVKNDKKQIEISIQEYEDILLDYESDVEFTEFVEFLANLIPKGVTLKFIKIKGNYDKKEKIIIKDIENIISKYNETIESED
jgi:hypothetical protein